MTPKSNLLKPELRVAHISGKLFFTAIIATAVISGGAVFLWQKNAVQRTTQDARSKENLSQEILLLREQLATINKGPGEEIPTTTENKEVTSTLATSTFKLGYKFYAPTSTNGEPYFQSPENKDIIYFDKKIYAKMKKDGEKTTGIYCPQNPSDSDIIFLSVSRQTTNPTSTLNKIYSYNVTNKEIKSIFEKKNKETIKILGMVENKLIVTPIKNELQLGKCLSVWAGHEETPYYYLDINNANKGLTSYEMPLDKIEAGRLEEQNCLEKK